MSSRRAFVGCILALTILVGCSEHRAIPEQELSQILTESLIRQSIISGSETSRRGGKTADTIDYHSAVLSKYGYDLEDFRYTIELMASRKSNPLDGILDKVSKDITLQAEVAETRYEQAKAFDAAALDKYRDTLYISDTIRQDDFEDFRFALTDSLLRGKIKLSITYKTMGDYRYKQKSIKYYLRDKWEKRPDIKTLWLSRSSGGRTTSIEMEINEPQIDSLVLSIEESRPSYIKKADIAKLSRDTSYISKIEITYTPFIEEARERYFRSFYGEDFTLNRPYLPIYDTLDLPAPHSIVVEVDSTYLKPKTQEIEWILER